MKLHSLILFFLLSGVALSLKAQSVKGVVVDNNNNRVSFATVQIMELGIGNITNEKGEFEIKLPQPGHYTLKTSFVGFVPVTQKISLTGRTAQTAHLKLESADTELGEVVVTEKSEVRKVREQAYNVSAIDIKQVHNTTKSISQSLNQTAGIKVREEGGLGSKFTFSLNGFTGKQVKFFIDGVPIDNFGSSLTINNLPVNLAERIEVYKGVVPVWLGADALGGAINVVTNQQVKQYVDASYSLGSFNTHQLALNSRLTNFNNGLTFNANAFYNYSDNNYKVDVQIPDPLTGKLDKTESLPRFHDQYWSAMGQIEGGIVNKPWADKLLVGVIYAENKKDIQTGMNMEQVAGMAYNTSRSVITTLKFKKTNAFVKGLSVVANANYGFIDAGVNDTSSRQYDWYGNYTVKKFGEKSGEISYNKTLFTFNDISALGNINLFYDFGNVNRISLNSTQTYYRRQGSDPIARYPIPFDEPNTLNKNISGLAYEFNSLNQKWTTVAFAKQYRITAQTVFAEWGDYTPQAVSNSKNGYGFALIYRVTDRFQLKSSFENSWRMPEGEEMFGDGLLLKNNPYLRPEHSYNVNMGALAGTSINLHKIEGEVNLLYRKSGDYIRLESDGIISQYTNLDSVRTTGIELQTRYSFANLFYVDVNGTYQHIVNTNAYDNNIKSAVYLDRLPNIPYLFGYAEAGLRLADVWTDFDLLTLTAGCSFVEQFYLFWPSQGSSGSKFYIPRQVTQNASVAYALKNGTYNIAFECSNISNAKVYDNFRLQKPGRAFRVKLRYYFSK